MSSIAPSELDVDSSFWHEVSHDKLVEAYLSSNTSPEEDGQHIEPPGVWSIIRWGDPGIKYKPGLTHHGHEDVEDNSVQSWVHSHNGFFNWLGMVSSFSCVPCVIEVSIPGTSNKDTAKSEDVGGVPGGLKEGVDIDPHEELIEDESRSEEVKEEVGLTTHSFISLAY